MQKKGCQLTGRHALSRAERYWYGACQNVYPVNVILHAVVVLGLPLTLRIVEVKKNRMENISVVSGNCTASITENKKIS